MVPADVAGADLAGLEFGKLDAHRDRGLAARARRALRHRPAGRRARGAARSSRAATVPSTASASRTSTPSRATTAASCTRARSTTSPTRSPARSPPRPPAAPTGPSAARRVSRSAPGRRTPTHRKTTFRHETTQRTFTAPCSPSPSPSPAAPRSRHAAAAARRRPPRRPRRPRPTPIPPPPELKARSYIVIDHDSGRVLAALDPDSRQEPASLTKLMTAYGVFRALKEGRIKLDDMVTISEHAWKQEGSRMFVEVGKQVSVENLHPGHDRAVGQRRHRGARRARRRHRAHVRADDEHLREGARHDGLALHELARACPIPSTT